MDKIKLLERINWDFAESKTNIATNAMHPYPAKFIPQIPHHFIKKLSKRGDTIYEPFLGSGTTAVEANIQKRHIIGNDVNPLAVLISKVKTTPIDSKKLLSLDNLLDRIHTQIKLLYTNKRKDIAKPQIARLDMWFEDFVINELAIIKEEIKKITDQDLVDFCLIVLSGIIIAVSRQDSDTRYVRVFKNIKPFDTFNKFSKQFYKLRKIIIKSNDLINGGRSILKVADTRNSNIFSENTADLAITSPPYPNAYDYHLYHKYRLFWLGMNSYNLRQNEIGSHADYSKKNALNEFHFMQDMRKCFLNTSKILKTGSYFILVIGNSILKGRSIQNNEILRQATQNTSFKYITEFTRSLKLNKKSFNPKIGHIKTEKILIFKNTK